MPSSDARVKISSTDDGFFVRTAIVSTKEDIVSFDILRDDKTAFRINIAYSGKRLSIDVIPMESQAVMVKSWRNGELTISEKLLPKELVAIIELLSSS